MPMRIAVTGRYGQVVRSLLAAGPTLGVEVIEVGWPELDLAVPKTVQPALAAIKPDIVVNAAARRPKNSRLDCRKLARLHGVQLPCWRTSLRACLERLTSGL